MAVAWNPDYAPMPSHLVGVYLGILVLAFLCNASPFIAGDADVNTPSRTPGLTRHALTSTGICGARL